MALVIGNGTYRSMTRLPNPSNDAQEIACFHPRSPRAPQLQMVSASSWYREGCPSSHLDHPLVKTGDMVKKGDALGVEGWTGAAGHRHLHFSIQKLPGQTEADWRSEIPTYAGQSVPFHFSAVKHGTVQKFSVADVHCAHASIGAAPPSQQPRFQGVP